MRNRRINFFLDLIKLAARKEDIEALNGILEFKYPGDHRIPGFAFQYYEKFIKGKNIATPLTEEILPQPLPDTIEELLTLLKATEAVKRKTKKEEFAEAILLKHPSVDLTNLNEDYLSWLYQRYIENKTKSGEIVHQIEDALVILRKFPSIQDKYKTSEELRKKVEAAKYTDISSIQGLTLDDMEKIISFDTSSLTVRVEGVEIEQESLGKFGEWNLWLPRTKETSAKIAGYDEAYNPKTSWCTARTRGSNLFYHYIGIKDVPAFLFYIIKDNPKNDEDWLSLSYSSYGNRLAPDFTGEDNGLSVDRANRGLTESDFSRILGDDWNSIKSRIETELERHKIVENGKKRYINPAGSIVERLAKNVEELRKELGPKSNEEKHEFIRVIMDSEPSEEVLKFCGNTLVRIKPYILDDYRFFIYYKLYKIKEYEKYIEKHITYSLNNDPKYFLEKYLEEPWAKPYIDLADIDLAAEKVIEKDPKYFLIKFSHKLWAVPYLELAKKKLAEKDPKYFLDYYSEKPWVKKDHIDLAAENYAKIDPYYFLYYYSEKPWVNEDHIDLAAENLAKINPYDFLFYFSEKSWVKKDHIDLAANILIEDDPKTFLNYFSKRPWVKPHHIELAESKLKAKQASNSIQKKLLKLSNFLKSNNLKEYNYLNYYIKE
jgi:hypothetical protein